MKRTLQQRRRAVGMAFATFVAAAVAAYALAWPETYEAESSIEVTPVPADDETFAGFSVLRADGDPVETAAQLVETQPIADAVAVRLRLDSGSKALDGVHAEAAPRGGVVRVRASAPTGVEAARLANAFADELVRHRSSIFEADLQRTIESLRAQLANVPATRRQQPPALDLARRLAELRTYEGRGDPTLRIAATATAPTGPARPRPLTILAVAAALVLLVGVTASLLAGALGRGRAERVHDEGAVASADEPARREERRLAERMAAVTARELEVARRAAQLARRERELEAREAEPESEPVPEPEPGREPELGSEPVAEPEQEREPQLSQGRNLVRLERAVADRDGELSTERREELQVYLTYLRHYAEPDGTLPASLDALVDEVFENDDGSVAHPPVAAE